MDEERFSRLAALVGAEGVERIGRARVAVFGLGGVGAACAETLARGGVGGLVLADGDVVEPSNANRQLLAFESTMGCEKAQVMASRVRDINPACETEAIVRFVLPDEAAALLDKLHAAAPLSYVVDCVDTVGTKLALARWAELHDVPYLGAAGTARKRDALAFRFADVYDTQVCPLCRVLRREARKQGIAPGRMRLLYSQEPPQQTRVQQAAAVVGTGGEDGTEGAEGAEGAGGLHHDGTADGGRAPLGTTGSACAPLGTADGGRAPLGTMPHVPPIAGMLMAGRVIEDLLAEAPAV